MYKFTYFDDRIRAIFADKDAFWDAEVEQELSPILVSLARFGSLQASNSNIQPNAGCKPGISGLVYEIRGQTFYLTYTMNADKKEIRFYEFKEVSHRINWEDYTNYNTDILEEKLIYIPQIGDPKKYLNAVELIDRGINTAQDLGSAFSSGARKERDIARRGYYIGRPLIEFGLANAHKETKKSSSIYILTDNGKRIAKSNDLETRERLLAESLLGYYPIQMIIEETTRGNKELTKSLIQKIIYTVNKTECGGTTNPRRASSLRALVNWVARWAGIPIRREGNHGVQLYIPYIYSE